ncbi:hypothetical protein Clacol_008410 [Clathrus columnatus]|uniref:BTB domain-containing protein n=1 Tax=Clathrus columnatus TaxID=1419009 RepID=A0AAV5AMS8_9AGAM|nr:hypothetical protein Clacol_008410 [Clathrus columnatus]
MSEPDSRLDIDCSTPIPKIQRCLSIYLEDANIALVTGDNVAFCVHRSVIRRLSVVISNMLEVCNVSKNDGGQNLDEIETFENLPVVRISDSSHVVFDFFQMVYDQKPILSAVQDYERVAALMIFCHKYMIDTTFERIISYLRYSFPDKLADWKSSSQTDLLDSEEVIHILLGATTANAKILIPSCLYLVVSKSKPKAHLYKLPQPLLLQYCQGFSQLSLYHFDFYESILEDLVTPSMVCREPKCNTQWNIFKKDIRSFFHNRGWISDPDPLLLLTRVYTNARKDVGYCLGCQNAIDVLFETALNELWDSLPHIFGIAKNWDTIRRETRFTDPSGFTLA